jgi:MtN3 and saliva related transmembrane protein
MTNDVLVDGLGYIAGFLIIVGYIPQLMQIIRTRKADDVSLHTYALLIVSQILWVVYGVLKNDARIVLTNVLSGLFAMMVFCSTIWIRQNKMEQEIIE